VAGPSRDDWIAAAMTLLSRGVSPADMTAAGLCEVMSSPVTRGSLSWHFRDGGLAALRREMISRWLAGREAAVSAAAGHRDPADRLRALREAAAASGPADSAMRRWAASPARPPAGQDGQQVRRELAAAIARADAITSGHLTDALADLGLSNRESAAAAATLAAAFAAWPLPPAGDPAVFEDMLAVLQRAASPDAPPAVQLIAGEADEVLLVLAARDLPPDQLSALRAAARRPGAPAPGPRPAAAAE